MMYLFNLTGTTHVAIIALSAMYYIYRTPCADLVWPYGVTA